MDHYKKAAEYIQTDRSFSNLLAVAGGAGALALATETVRSGQYLKGNTGAPRIAGDYDNSEVTAFQMLCAWVGLISGYLTIHQEMIKAGTFIAAERLLERIRTEARSYWVAVAKAADPAAQIIYYAARDGILEPFSQAPQLKRTLSSRLRRGLLWFISLTGSLFAIAWAFGSYMRGDNFVSWGTILSIYLASAFTFSGARAVVMGRELLHAHRRIKEGDWRLVDMGALPVDPTPGSLLQLVSNIAGHAAPSLRKQTKLIVRLNGGAGTAQAIGTMQTMHDYVLLPLDTSRLANPAQREEFEWTLLHELGHMRDSTDVAQKGARLVAVLTTLGSSALVAPLAIDHPAAWYFVAAALVCSLLRWTLHSTFREAQADFMAMWLLLLVRPVSEVWELLIRLDDRYRVGTLGGSLHQRMKGWIRQKMLVPSWKTHVGLQESSIVLFTQLINAVFSGLALLAAWYGGYRFGLYDSFTTYAQCLNVAAFIFMAAAGIAMARILLRFNAAVAKLPPLS